MQVTILMYHMVAVPENVVEARFCRTPEAFRKDMQQICKGGYQVVSLATVLDGIAGKAELPDRVVAITFDDGVACAYENALPILQEFGYSASVFVVSGQVGGYNDFSESYGFPRRRMLTASEIRALAAASIDIGSHTVNHIRLGKVRKDTAIIEIQDSKKALEDILGQKVTHFAYPFGSWSAVVRNAVMEAGYTGACSTMPRPNRYDADPYLLRRSEIKGSDAPWQFRLKLRFATNDMLPVSEVRRLARHSLEKLKLLSPRVN